MRLGNYNWSIQVAECVRQSEERVFVRCVVLMGYQTMTQNVAVSRALPCSGDEISCVVWA